MRVELLIEAVTGFRDKLEVHFALYRKSLSQPLPRYPVRNHDELEQQSRELSQLLGAIRPFLEQYTNWILHYQATGARWDALNSAVGLQDIAVIKGDSVRNVLPILDQYIGYLKSLPVDSVVTGGKSPTNRRVVFLSISFDPVDEGLNNHFKDILTSLEVPVESGERYSQDTVPEKVRKRIEKSDVFLLILVGRSPDGHGKFAPPAWLMKEYGIAIGNRKEVICLVEHSVGDLGGLNMEKELILFDRTDLAKADVRLMQALKAHKLV